MKKIRIKRKVIYLLIMLLTGVCIVPMQAVHASVKLNVMKATIVEGSSLKLVGMNLKKNLNWISSNPEIARVSSNGLVTARKKGKTVIIVRSGKQVGRCKITVKGAKVSKTENRKSIYRNFLKKTEAVVRDRKIRLADSLFALQDIDHDKKEELIVRESSSMGYGWGDVCIFTVKNKKIAYLGRIPGGGTVSFPGFSKKSGYAYLFSRSHTGGYFEHIIYKVKNGKLEELIKLESNYSASTRKISQAYVNGIEVSVNKYEALFRKYLGNKMPQYNGWRMEEDSWPGYNNFNYKENTSQNRNRLK